MRMVATGRTLSVLLLLCAGCLRSPSGQAGQAGAGAEADAGTDKDPLVKTTTAGPVKVTLTLAPQHPRLGDRLSLTLTAEAPAQVTVELPPFGEALGRFAIVSFTPRSATLPDDSTRLSQRYVLDPPSSGAHRIPPLRVAFTDRRQGGPDGGAREVFTDELPVHVAAVAPEGEASAELRPLRGPLPEDTRTRQALRLALPALVVGLLVAGWLAVRALRRRAARILRASAYDVALARLQRLVDRGPPDPSEADRFYVELSDVVRRYIEDRYGVRAPELTTEEFLREARHLRSVAEAQRALLTAFLSACDRVKFAGYRPATEESASALRDARRFLDETRPATETPGGAP